MTAPFLGVWNLARVDPVASTNLQDDRRYFDSGYSCGWLLARALAGGRNAAACPMITPMKIVLHAEDLYWLGDTASERAHDP